MKGDWGQGHRSPAKHALRRVEEPAGEQQAQNVGQKGKVTGPDRNLDFAASTEKGPARFRGGSERRVWTCPCPICPEKPPS